MSSAQIRTEMNRLNEIQAALIKQAKEVECSVYELTDRNGRIAMLDVVVGRSNLLLADAIERNMKKR